MMYESLLTAWAPLPHSALAAPPKEPIKLWGEGARGVWIADSWGPMVPYPPADHRDGNRNSGYRRTKGDMAAVRGIPEVADWPELGRFLETLNAIDTPVESVGCERGFSLAEDRGQATVMLGSYIDVIFTDTPLNERPENILLLISRLAPTVEGCEKWWGDVSFVLQRFRGIWAANAPWGMMLSVKNYGRSEPEARNFWGETLSRLGKAISALPRDLAKAT